MALVSGAVKKRYFSWFTWVNTSKQPHTLSVFTRVSVMSPALEKTGGTDYDLLFPGKLKILAALPKCNQSIQVKTCCWTAEGMVPRPR